MNRLPLLLLLSLLTTSFCAGTIPQGGVPIRVALRADEEILSIPLERYVVGVLEKEVHQDWPLEALKAQAVATRTYALFRKENPRAASFDVYADTSDQVFEPMPRHAPSVIKAVRQTEGEVLTYDGRIFQAFFHSCCGGHSEQADHVWPGIKTPPLQGSHPDDYCTLCPSAHWELRLSREELGSLVAPSGRPIARDEKIIIMERDASGRVSRVKSSGRRGFTISGIDFRERVGHTRLKSTLFDVTDEGEVIVLTGRGAGHGVGLCQWGAKGMADEGNNYRQILEFYYPGARIAGPEGKGPVDEDLGEMIQALPGNDFEPAAEE